MGMVAVEGTCPEVDLPSHSPAGSGVAALLERVDRGLVAGGVAVVAAHLVEGIETHQVREVTVTVGAGRVAAVLPLSQDGRALGKVARTVVGLGGKALVELGKLVAQVVQVRSADIGSAAQYLHGLQSVVEELPHELLRMGHTVLRGRAVLG